MSDPTTEPSLEAIASGGVFPQADTEVAQEGTEAVNMRTPWRTASFDSQVPGAPVITQEWTAVPKSLSSAVLDAAANTHLSLEVE